MVPTLLLSAIALLSYASASPLGSPRMRRFDQFLNSTSSSVISGAASETPATSATSATPYGYSLEWSSTDSAADDAGFSAPTSRAPLTMMRPSMIVRHPARRILTVRSSTRIPRRVTCHQRTSACSGTKTSPSHLQQTHTMVAVQSASPMDT